MPGLVNLEEESGFKRRFRVLRAKLLLRKVELMLRARIYLLLSVGA